MSGESVVSYRPYRTYTWFCSLLFGIAILSFIMLGYCLTIVDKTFLFSLFIGAVSIFLSKYFYDKSNIVIFFDIYGVRKTGGRYKDYQYMPWYFFSNAYYTRNYKGYLFLVLSSDELSVKEAKRMIRSRTPKNDLKRSCVLVVPMDSSQDMSAINRVVFEHVKNVVFYCEI